MIVHIDSRANGEATMNRTDQEERAPAAPARRWTEGRRLSSEPPLGAFAAWAELVPSDWKTAVMAMADAVWRRLPEADAAATEFGRIRDQVLTKNTKLGLAVESEGHELVDLALSVGSTVGYAVAKTWPNALEGLDEWPRRAAEYAGWAPRDRWPNVGDRSGGTKPLGTFNAFREYEPRDWQTAVTSMADAIWRRLPQADAAYDAIDKRVEQLQATDEDLAIELSNGATELAALARYVSASIGYAVAKTWPNALEDLDEWPRRAAEYAGWAPTDVPVLPADPEAAD